MAPLRRTNTQARLGENISNNLLILRFKSESIKILEQNRKEEPIWIIIHIYMEMSQ
jgi:hypothetical protein